MDFVGVVERKIFLREKNILGVNIILRVVCDREKYSEREKKSCGCIYRGEKSFVTVRKKILGMMCVCEKNFWLK